MRLSVGAILKNLWPYCLTSNNDPTAGAGSQKPEGHFIVLNVEHIKMWKDILEKYVNYPCICDKDDVSNVTKEMADVLKLIKY